MTCTLVKRIRTARSAETLSDEVFVMSSISHSVRCAFKDALKAAGMKGASELKLSAIKVKGTGRTRNVDVSLPGAFVDGNVHLYDDGAYCAVIVSALTLVGVTWLYTYHWAWLP